MPLYLRDNTEDNKLFYPSPEWEIKDKIGGSLQELGGLYFNTALL